MLTRVRTSWPRGVVPSGQNLRDLDQNTYAAIDGYAGGSYTPSGNIIIGGKGLAIVTKSVLSGSAVLYADSDSPLTFGKLTSDDALRYASGHTARSRSLLRNIDEVWPTTGDGSVAIDTGPAVVRTQSNGARFFVPLRIFDGATLDTVVFRWAVGNSHSSVPDNLPRFRIVRVDSTGVVEALRAEDTTTDSDGWVVWGPRPSTGAGYYDSGNGKTFTYTCNQNNVLDRSQYAYLGQVEDESGSNAFSGSNGNYFRSTTSAHSNILHLALRQ